MTEKDKLKLLALDLTTCYERICDIPAELQVFLLSLVRAQKRLRS